MPAAFIGRNRELGELLAGLQDAIDGRGGALLITGEPGIGKTALADQLTARAVERGAQVLWGRCWERAGAPPYWPWRQILGGLSDRLDDETLQSIASSARAEIAPLVPDLAARLGKSPDRIHPIESDARRFYLFEAVATVLKSASSAHPLVLVFDDLHEADAPSLLLLRFVAGDVRRTRILVVVTARDPGAARSPDAESVLEALAREGPSLGLTGLGREDVGRLVEQISGVRPGHETVSAIHHATDGNPLFVREITRHVITHDGVDQSKHPRIPLPQSVRAVIRRRLSPLSVDAVGVLSAAAVVGRDFDLTLVAPASELPNERVLGSLSEALAMGIVSEEPAAPGRFRFSHQLMRDVIYDELAIPKRIQLHRLIGEAMESLPGRDPQLNLAQLAYHFAQAAPAGEGEKAREYALRAGDQAMEACAYEEAVVQYRRGLESLGFTGRDEALRCELLLRLGSGLARAGDYQEARASYLAAVDIARKLGDAERLALAALGFGEPQVEGGIVDRRLVGLLEEALDALPPGDGPLRARLMSRLSLELTFSEKPELRETLSREAVDMARQLGEVVPLTSALRARWLAVWEPDGLAERSALADEILELAAGIDDRETELIGRARRITCSMESGDILAAQVDISAHAELAKELRMPYHLWTSASMRAMRALFRGSLEMAEELADIALVMLPSRREAIYAHLNQLTPIRWDQGRLAELRSAWHEILDAWPQAGCSRGWLCLAEAELGRSDDAYRWLRSEVDAIHALPRNGIWAPDVAVAATAAAELEDEAAAASVYPLLLPYADRVIVMSMPHPVVCFGSALRYIALLEATMSRWDEADERFRAAIDANIAMGASSMLARTQYEYARMLSRRGRAGDRSRALDLLDRAAATARAQGMDGIQSGIERLRELMGGRAVAATWRRDAFRREGEYWTVVYEGSLARLRDSKGLRYLSLLLAQPGREFHVIDLEATHREAATRSSLGRGSGARDLAVRSDLGDAGEMLDATARAAYKARLEHLQAELDEAESFNDPARAARAKGEIDFLTSELARAVGLGRRDRRAAAHSERARLNVTRAIRSAIRNLARANPSLGQHLSSTIRTGRYCSYTPDPRAGAAWDS